MRQIQTRPWRRFAAVGDSYTEGLDDLLPDDTYRGWADLLALELDELHPGMAYANLAIRGRKVADVCDRQVPAALALDPDLVSIAIGVNDMMRPSVDVSYLADQVEQAVSTVRETGSDVLLTAFGDPSASSWLVGRIADRIGAYDVRMREIAEKYDCGLVDYWYTRGFDSRRYWSPDRLHLSTQGHIKATWAALEALGIADDAWNIAVPDDEDKSFAERRREDYFWVKDHFGPWVLRHARGRSSGDGLEPKRPRMLTLAEAPIIPPTALGTPDDLMASVPHR